MTHQSRSKLELDIQSAIAAGEAFLAALDNDIDPDADETPVRARELTPADLQLVTKKIPVRYCEYKISNNASKMLQTETISVSNRGMMFTSMVPFTPGTLMRVWVDMPDFWARKSRHVAYRHTNAPSYFQVLCRVVSCVDQTKRTPKFQMLCESVNLDPVDERILCEYLNIEYKPREQ
jgi:hypothetical protein